MKKMLIIAYVFPPIAYAGTHRTLRLCKHLSRLGYSIDVLTIDVQEDLHNDFQLLNSIHNDVNIVRTPIWDPYRLYRKFKAKLGNGLAGKIGSAIIGRAMELISKPDHMVFWVASAFKTALRIIKEKQPTIVYTTSPPHSEQILGYLLKKVMPSIKWVADMRDPLLDNLIIDQISTTNRLAHQLLERQIARHADAVIFNTCDAMQRFEQRYHNRKSRLIRNSYDEESFEFSPLAHYDQFTIAHVGSIYAFRNVDPLFEAISVLARVSKIDDSMFKLMFVGLNDKSLQEKIIKFGIERFVEIKGMVSHRQAIEIMLRSHLLLLVKGLGENSGSQIPGKLYEYLASGNQIVHIGPLKSEAASIIESEKAGRTFSDNIEDIADYILDGYQKFLSAPQSCMSMRPNRNKFSSRNMAMLMHQLFQSLK